MRNQMAAIQALMQMKPLMEQFRERHPKFVKFFGYVGNRITDGTLIEISVTGADGKKVITNLRVSQEDLALVEQMKNLLTK